MEDSVCLSYVGTEGSGNNARATLCRMGFVR